MSSPDTSAASASLCRLLTLAAGQHGVFVTSQAGSAGLSRYRLYRLRDRGIIEDAGYGAWRVAGSHPTWWQRAHHTLLVAGDGAALTRTTALGLHLGRGSLRRGPIHVVVDYRRSVRFPANVRAHRSRTHDPASHIDRFGLTTTNVARALVEAGIDQADRWWSDVVASALRSRLTTFSSLAEALEAAGPVPNARRMAAQLARLNPTTIEASRSQPEVTLHDLVVAAGLPRPVLNYQLTSGEHVVAEIDLAWPDVRFGTEVDSEQFHGLPLAQTRDHLKDSRIFDLGWFLRRVPVSMIRHNPSEAVRIVERGLAQARRQVLSAGDLGPGSLRE